MFSFFLVLPLFAMNAVLYIDLATSIIVSACKIKTFLFIREFFLQILLYICNFHEKMLERKML